MLHEHPLDKAARYRHTAEYIADAALTDYLIRMAEDCERQASEASLMATVASPAARGGSRATPA